ncbi:MULTISPECIES: RHS repeat-associated core domain-containing protein [unclassified Pseudomonas]|uniref:RHS repeat-associated core domain-containing protein n=1 Tax=unclassified Pseudomonas TaxID=196821 RepID=UPI001CBFC85C|nr:MULTISPECIES: RHS repeat-associated core domain-containing protein [unclassified Pseudomonas]
MAPINSVQQRAVLLATDRQNSVLAEVAGDTNRIAYSVYGHWSAQHTVMTRLGFNGELCEARIDWYLLGNGYRAYNPRLMRFHSPDSLSPFEQGGLNAYMYCGGEPVMNKDPTGHAFFPSLTTLRNNVATLVGRYQEHRAVGQNPVNALISTVSGSGGLPNTLGASSPEGLTPAVLPTTHNVLPTAKDGGLHHNVGGVPSSTPAPQSNASLPSSSGSGPGGGYKRSYQDDSWHDSRAKMDDKQRIIKTRYPDEVKRSLSPNSQKKVTDVRK